MTIIKMEKKPTQTEKDIKVLEAIQRTSMEEVGKILEKMVVDLFNQMQIIKVLINTNFTFKNLLQEI